MDGHLFRRWMLSSEHPAFKPLKKTALSDIPSNWCRRSVFAHGDFYGMQVCRPFTPDNEVGLEAYFARW